ncbi:MAG: GNAT family N-acetyltransferase, partial [Caulobacteraceae bacterium]
MLKADIFRPHDLPEDDAAAWRAMCEATPAFGNPLLSLEFAQLVAEVRDDARVAVFRNGGKVAGLLAYHKRPDGFARPIGAAFSDYHALITPPRSRLNPREALTAAGISAWRFNGLLDPHGLFRTVSTPASQGYVLEIPDAEAYRADLKAANPTRFKNWGRLRNKLEREAGELALTPGETSREAFDQLMEWKREQFRKTGSHDVYRAEWASALLDRTFAASGPLKGTMSVLRAGGEIAAGHFGPALNRSWHGWISSINPAHVSCGPGLVMMMHVPEIMAALDLASYDMAP